MLKLKHVDLDRNLLEQDAREVRTKASKSFPTVFFPVGGNARAIVADWVIYLRTERLFGFDDPLFPASLVRVGPEGQFQADGVDRRHWSNAGPIRKISRKHSNRPGCRISIHIHSARRLPSLARKHAATSKP
jgi:hypothetical protein